MARTLGDAPWRAFRRVTLPLSMRGLIAAAIVMWARAVSEFGAIVVLAYNPKVASVLSYDRFTGYGLVRGAAGGGDPRAARVHPRCSRSAPCARTRGAVEP